MKLQFLLLKISGLILTIIVTACARNTVTDGFRDNYIQYNSKKLTPEEKQILTESLVRSHKRYDPEVKMITTTLNGYNYHTDAESGVFHDVRGSLSYAVDLLDLEADQYRRRAFDTIGQSDYNLYMYLSNNNLTSSKGGQFISVNYGQGQWLFQYSHPDL